MRGNDEDARVLDPEINGEESPAQSSTQSGTNRLDDLAKASRGIDSNGDLSGPSAVSTNRRRNLRAPPIDRDFTRHADNRPVF